MLSLPVTHQKSYSEIIKKIKVDDKFSWLKKQVFTIKNVWYLLMDETKSTRIMIERFINMNVEQKSSFGSPTSPSNT